MNVENMYISSPDTLIKSLSEEFFRGARLIGKLEESIYRQTITGTGSIGGHFRHNLDFANAFLTGIKEGKIDYNRRERDLRVEENRLYAIKRFALMICRLRNLSPEIFSGKVLVNSEIDVRAWHESSAVREFEFLHSHTVHHHALIAEKLIYFDLKAPTNFGVAPATLRFRAEQRA